MRYLFIALAMIWLSPAHAYSVSMILEQRLSTQYSAFRYGYSSQFKHQRDNLHWLDLAYSDYVYRRPDEFGHSSSWEVTYRYA